MLLYSRHRCHSSTWVSPNRRRHGATSFLPLRKALSSDTGGRHSSRALLSCSQCCASISCRKASLMPWLQPLRLQSAKTRRVRNLHAKKTGSLQIRLLLTVSRKQAFPHPLQHSVKPSSSVQTASGQRLQSLRSYQSMTCASGSRAMAMWM